MARAVAAVAAIAEDLRRDQRCNTHVMDYFEDLRSEVCFFEQNRDGTIFNDFSMILTGLHERIVVEFGRFRRILLDLIVGSTHCWSKNLASHVGHGLDTQLKPAGALAT